ncbi:hypothetical protein H8F21_15440 [Pseudomonas sp. P66]|uniref:SprT-like domain-containing protein n=1 Tax=Pseudomonas arcuscaelestis TaxID=2710591 RepID=A0ABS2BZT9_9PSED|nr:hypothetical protein [Pseudomonas arcuscaelestis]MBM5458960.1 hypothetical protein [Pseudomonas arcuscaelestis]
MNTENLKFPLIYQHNAEFAREIHAAKEVSRLLQKVDFPGDDVWIDLRFDYALSDHSTSSLDVMLIRGQPHGIVKLNLQGLYLMQDFEVMIQQVIPHEIAHILHGVKAKVGGYEIQKPHDEEWAELFINLIGGVNHDIEPSAKVRGEFDDRAIRLSKSGILVECECGDDESLEVLADTPGNSAKLRNEELECTSCKFPYVRFTGDTLPKRIAADQQFLEKIKCIKLQHSPLQR